MKHSKPSPIAVVGDRCGEGAVWSAAHSAVYWVDINRFLIHRLDYPSRQLHTWVFDEPVVALALSEEDQRLLVALGSKLIWWWPDSDQRQDHGFTLPASPTARLNDGRCDPRGQFWVGSMFNNVSAEGASISASGTPGVLYRIAADGCGSPQLSGLQIANTLCWSPDRSTFYFGDSPTNTIRAFAYDAESGEIGPGVPFFSDFERGEPDGSAMDRDGYLWNCRYGGSGIARIAPDGQLERFIEMPTRNPTTCVFGGPDLSTLFITSAANDTTPGDRLAGSLWMIETDVAGLPENRVKLS